MVKLSLPKVKLVWHDHYGRDLTERKPGLIKYASRYFDGIIAVNKDLESWSKQNLSCKTVQYIRNFLPKISASGEQVELKGGESFKIICVANFRPQKDHLNLLKAFQKVIEEYPQTTLHLIGKDEQTLYSAIIKRFIKEKKLQQKVFIYGEVENIYDFLKLADIGVLSSVSEGLPVALLEYGRAGLPVVCTKVGECPTVTGEYSKLVPPKNPEAMAKALNDYFRDGTLAKTHGEKFKEAVQSKFSEEIVIPGILQYFVTLEVKKHI